MKMKQLIAVCGMAAALMLSLGMASAQDNGNGGGGGGGNGGPGGGGGGGFRQRGNFDPAQFQQRIMDNARDALGFTNDTDWAAVQPLVQKVMDATRDAGGGNMMKLFRGNRGGNRGGGQGGQGGRPRGGMFGGTPSPEEEALQKGIDDDVPAGQIKELLTRYQAAQKTKHENLKAAQDALRAVLTTKQEAVATLDGLLD